MSAPVASQPVSLSAVVVDTPSGPTAVPSVSVTTTEYASMVAPPLDGFAHATVAEAVGTASVLRASDDP